MVNTVAMTRRSFAGVASAVAGAVASGFPAVAQAAPVPQGVQVIKFVSSLPMTGSSYGQTISIINGIRMAIEEVDRKAGDFVIEFEALDDATAAAGKWTADKEAENAHKALNDADVMVYLGTFNSGAAKVSIPILNAVGLVMISPATTYPGLTKPGKGDITEPEIYYPSGVRNFSRVGPADDLQGAVGAKFAKKLGAKSAYVIDDTELYGKGIADVFVQTAPGLGLAIAGRDGIDGKASDYRAVATKVRAARPDVIYFGGITQNNAGKLLKDLRAAGVDAPFIGPAGIIEDAFIKDAGDDAEGVYCTFGGIPVTSYEGDAKLFAEKYARLYGGSPEAYSIYGYEAARVALAAVAKANVKDRVAIRDAVFATRDFKGMLGTWSFDAYGDTTQSTLSVNEIKRNAAGKLEFVLVEVMSAT